jgi:two-component system LytT family response regulator
MLCLPNGSNGLSDGRLFKYFLTKHLFVVTNLSAAIIDDDEVICDALELQLKNHCPEINILFKCSDPHQAGQLISQHSPEIVFLDIEMPGLTGLELLSKFPDPLFHVIFVTAHDKFALRAFRFSAVDYLLKPVESDDLIEAVGKAKNRVSHDPPQLNVLLKMVQELKVSQAPKRVALPTANEVVIVGIDEIIFCEGDGNYTKVIMTNGSRIVLSKTLKILEDFLDDRMFFRIHNAYLININHIRKVNRRDGGSIIMDNNADLPMSRYRRQDFFEKFNYL